MFTFRYTGPLNGIFHRDPATGKNEHLPKGKDFTTDSEPLAAELRQVEDVREVKEAKGDEQKGDRPPKANGKP